MSGQSLPSRMAGFPKLSNAARSDGMADLPEYEKQFDYAWGAMVAEC